jgi:hypothetical protein
MYFLASLIHFRHNGINEALPRISRHYLRKVSGVLDPRGPGPGPLFSVVARRLAGNCKHRGGGSRRAILLGLAFLTSMGSLPGTNQCTCELCHLMRQKVCYVVCGLTRHPRKLGNKAKSPDRLEGLPCATCDPVSHSAYNKTFDHSMSSYVSFSVSHRHLGVMQYT